MSDETKLTNDEITLAERQARGIERFVEDMTNDVILGLDEVESLEAQRQVVSLALFTSFLSGIAAGNPNMRAAVDAKLRGMLNGLNAPETVH